MADLADREGPDLTAVAQDAEAIAEPADVGHAVGDEEDGGVARPQFGDAPFKPFDVMQREGRGRLVE